MTFIIKAAAATATHVMARSVVVKRVIFISWLLLLLTQFGSCLQEEASEEEEEGSLPFTSLPLRIPPEVRDHLSEGSSASEPPLSPRRSKRSPWRRRGEQWRQSDSFIDNNRSVREESRENFVQDR